MFPYLFFLINFLTEVAHKTKLVRQRVRSHVSYSNLKLRWRLGLSPFSCTSVQGVPCCCHDTTSTIFRSQLLPPLTTWDGCFVLFSQRFLVFRNTEKGLKNEPERDQCLQGNSTPCHKQRAITLHCAKELSRALEALPLPLLLSFSCLLPQTHLQACTRSPPFQEFYYCFQDGREEGKSELCQVCRAEQGEMRVEQLGMRVGSEVQTKQNPQLGAGTGLKGSSPGTRAWGCPRPLSGSLWTPAPGWLSAHQSLRTPASLPRSINRSSWAQLGSVPHLALPFAPTRSERYPATTAATFRTHVTEVQTTNPRLWHIHRLPGWAPLTPPPPHSSSRPAPPQASAPRWGQAPPFWGALLLAGIPPLPL